MWLFKKSKKDKISIPLSEQDFFCAVTEKKPYKIDTALQVPEGYAAFLCYQRKIYYELIKGDYVLNTLTIPDIIRQQVSLESNGIFPAQKIKKFKVQIFMLKNADFKINFVIVCRRYKFADKIKSNLNLSCEFILKAENSRLLLKNLLEQNFFLNKDKALKTIRDWLYEDIEIYIKKQPLKRNQSFFDSTYDEIMQEKLNKEYKAVGLNIVSLNLRLSKKENLQNNNSIFAPNTVADKRYIEAKQYSGQSVLPAMNDNSRTLTLNATRENTADRFCPNCESKIIEGSVYCHVCGFKVG